MGPQRFGSIGLVLAVLVSMQPLAVTARADTDFRIGLLWRVEAANGARNHVFGILALTDQRLSKLPEPVIAAILSSRSLTHELEYSIENYQELASISALRTGQSLEEIIGRDLFARLADRTKSFDIHEQHLLQRKPWAVAMALSVTREEVARQVAGAKPADFAFFASAHMRGLPIFTFDTLMERYAPMDELPIADQVSLLRLSIEAYPNIDAAVEQLIGLYLARDLVGIKNWWPFRRSKLGARLASLIERRMLFDRNVAIVNRIKARLVDGGAFIAVGAAHLAGQKGILDLLVRHGFRVKKVY